MVDPSNINATSLSIAALQFTAPQTIVAAESEARQRALDRLDQLGGYAAVGDPSRCTLSGPCRTMSALAGLMDWRAIKRLRPEVILLPRRVRRTISTTFPAYLSISNLHALSAPDPRNLLPTYPLARRRSIEWLRRAQGQNGSFEESAFLSSLIVACWAAAGRTDISFLKNAVDFVARSQRPDGSWPIDRDLETFDTDMTVLALSESGESVPSAAGVRQWLLDRQINDSCFPTSAPPGGWAWAMPAGWPECDDTSYTILALRRLGHPASHPAIRKGVRWLEQMQNRDGSWSTFVRDSRMPFDHDCPYITGHVLSALRAADKRRGDGSSVDRALSYLQRAQRQDGTFASIWFREPTAGTASVLEALADWGLAATAMAQRAFLGLRRNQNPDGGWGGSPGTTSSTAEETAWAVLALLRENGAENDPQVLRGLEWLMQAQRPDGGWDQWPVGLYYSAMWYSDSYFALTLPAQALGRARKVLDGRL